MARYIVLSEKYWTGHSVAVQGDTIELPQSGLKGKSLEEVKAKPKGEPKGEGAPKEGEPKADELA